MSDKKQSEIQADYLYNIIANAIERFCLENEPVDLTAILIAISTHKGQKLALVPKNLRNNLNAKLNNLEERAFQEALSKYGDKVAKTLNDKGDIIQ